MDTETATRYAIGCAVLVVAVPLGLFLLVGPPTDGSAERASEVIRQNTGGASTDSPPAALPADPVSSRFPLPAGWSAEDPFTDQSRYWPEFTFLSQALPRDHVERILFRSPNEQQSQLFLMIGPAEELLAELSEHAKERKQHPLLTGWKNGSVTSADDLKLSLSLHGIGEGLVSGDAIEQVSGFVKQGDTALVIDAGGAAETFDANGVLRLLKQLEIEPLLAGSS